MNVKLIAGWFYGALIIALSVWVLQSFLIALLVACVTAVASWPLYRRLAARLPGHMPRSVAPLIFTSAITVFVLAPLSFALVAMFTEAHALLVDIAAADVHGIAVPHWLEKVPQVGPWLATRWQSELAHPGALFVWAQRTDLTALLGWAQSIGQFMARHVFIVGFTVLVLFFIYRQGESLARDFRRVLRDRIGEQVDGYLDLATRAVRASVNSMLVVGLFDGFATWIAYILAGAPHAALWAAITGLLALVPFLGYVAVAALSLQLAMKGAAAALLACTLGSLILFCGDKIVRPVVAANGAHLPFVWVLMGCLGGFEVLGLVGLVVGPVALTLARQLWEQRVRQVSLPGAADPTDTGRGSA